MTTATLTPTARAKAMEPILAEARTLMAAHGLHDWTLKVSRAKNTAGHCFSAAKEIALSGVLLPMWPAADVTNTILHEIAHALTPTDPGHGPEWRRVVVEIGGTPERLFPDHLPRPGRRLWVCTCKCEGMESRHKRRADTRCWGCDARHLWRREGEPQDAAKPYNSRWSRNHTIDLGMAMGATRDSAGLKAPKGKLWTATESHYIDHYSDSAEALEQFRDDVNGGLFDCGDGDCWTCKN